MKQHENDNKTTLRNKISDAAIKSNSAVQGAKSSRFLDSNYLKYLGFLVLVITILFLPKQCSPSGLNQNDIDLLTANLKQEIKSQGIPITDEQLAKLARRLNATIRNSDEYSAKYATKIKEGEFAVAADIQIKIAESHMSLSGVLKKESALSFLDAGILYLPTDQIKAKKSFLSALKADPTLMDACAYVSTLDFYINGNISEAINSLKKCEPTSKEDQEGIKKSIQFYEAMNLGDYIQPGRTQNSIINHMGKFGDYFKKLVDDCYNELDGEVLSEETIAIMYADLTQKLQGNSKISTRLMYSMVPLLSMCDRLNEAQITVTYLESLPNDLADSYSSILLKVSDFDLLYSQSKANYSIGEKDAAKQALHEATKLWNSNISKYGASTGNNLRFLNLMDLNILIYGNEKSDLLLGKYNIFMSVTDPKSSLFPKSFFQAHTLLSTLSDYMSSQWQYFSQEQRNNLVDRNYELVKIFADISPDKEQGRYNESMSLDRLISWYSDIGEYDTVEQVIQEIESIYDSRTVFDRAHGLSRDFYYLRLEANKLVLSESQGAKELTDKYLALHKKLSQQIPADVTYINRRDWEKLENIILSNTVNAALSDGRLHDIGGIDDRILELHLQWSINNRPYEDYMSSLNNLLMTHIRKAVRYKNGGELEKARDHLETVVQTIKVNEVAPNVGKHYRVKFMAVEGILELYKSISQRLDILETCKSWLLDESAMKFFLEEDDAALKVYYDTMFLASEVLNDQVYLDKIAPSLDFILKRMNDDLWEEKGMALSRRLGSAYFQFEKYKKSRKYFSKCYVFGKKSKSVDKDILFESAYCAGLLGDIESKQGNTIKARRYLNYSIEVFEKLASKNEDKGAKQNLEYFENLLASLK